MTSRRTLLLVLVLAAVAALAWQLRPVDEAPAGTAAAPSNRAGGAAAAAPTAEDSTDVKLELLHADAMTLTVPSRNPFRFEEAPPPPPPRDLSPERPPEFSPPVAAGPPPPPPIPLRFIGYVAREGTMTAAFSDGRGNVFHGREGDIIEGRYKVLRVGTDSVELAYLDGRGRQTIRLSGQ